MGGNVRGANVLGANDRGGWGGGGQMSEGQMSGGQMSATTNLRRSLANAQPCPRVLLSVLYLKNMPLSKLSIPCTILKTYI